MTLTRREPSHVHQAGPASMVSRLVGLSLLVNLLLLTGPVFMLQVYDRVLTSASVATLVGLFLIVVLLYTAYGAFDYLRTRMAALRAEEWCARQAGPAFDATIAAETAGSEDGRRHGVSDLETLRGFATSPVLVALSDLPAVPLYLGVVFLLHPVLGIAAVLASILLAVVAIANERMTRKRVGESAEAAERAHRFAGESARAAGMLSGNAMTAHAGTAWASRFAHLQATSQWASRRTNAFTTLTRTLRLTIQSLILAIGAWLVIAGTLTPGAMIAASIIFSRALAPLEQVLSGFRSLLNARASWTRMQAWLNMPDPSRALDLPAPRARMEVCDLDLCLPGADTPLLSELRFQLKAGDALAVIGASGSGKSTLARALCGAWPLASGRVTLDGADLAQWPRDALTHHLGYLPQDIALLEGTIAENIARFTPGARDADILAAAQAGGVHDLILSKPEGYATRLGPNGAGLSGGECQRIALARALYGDPFLAVLDEPDSHLDGPGRTALGQAISARRRAGKITIIIAHSDDLVRHCSKLLALEAGRMKVFGPRDAARAFLQQERRQKTAVPAA